LILAHELAEVETTKGAQISLNPNLLFFRLALVESLKELNPNFGRDEFEGFLVERTRDETSVLQNPTERVNSALRQPGVVFQSLFEQPDDGAF
jgi:hypothetical protein